MVAGVPCYAFRAIDEPGQVLDSCVGPTRDTEAAIRSLARAAEETGVRPRTATTDRAAIYVVRRAIGYATTNAAGAHGWVDGGRDGRHEAAVALRDRGRRLTQAPAKSPITGVGRAPAARSRPICAGLAWSVRTP